MPSHREWQMVGNAINQYQAYAGHMPGICLAYAHSRSQMGKECGTHLGQIKGFVMCSLQQLLGKC